MARAALLGQLANRCRRTAERRREVDKGVPAIQRRDRIQRTGGQRAFLGIVQQLIELVPSFRHQCGIHRRLGRRNVDHDQPRQLVGFDELVQIALDPLDGFTRRLFDFAERILGEFLDRTAYIGQRAGPERLFDFVQFLFALVENVEVDRPAFGVHSHRFVEQPAGANVVAADDKIFPAGQVAVGEQIGCGDQSGVADQAFLQSDKSDDGGGGYAAFCANQPDANTTACHDAQSFVANDCEPKGNSNVRKWINGPSRETEKSMLLATSNPPLSGSTRE